MKLIHKSTGLEVREGDTVRDFRGEAGIVIGWTKPRSPQSSGRITIDHKGIEHHCYPEVYSCEWIDREDRVEETKLCERCGQTLHAPIHCGTCGSFDHPFAYKGYTMLGHGGDKPQISQPTPVGGFETETSSVFGIPYKDLGSPDKPMPSLPSVNSLDRTKELVAEVEEQFEQIRKTLNEIKALLS